MQEIRCPRCGEVFQVDETGYAQIAQQVRDKEFKKELERRENVTKSSKRNLSAAKRILKKNRKKKPHRLTLPWMICSIIFHRMIFRQGMQQRKKKPVFRGKVRWKLQYHPMRMISR